MASQLPAEMWLQKSQQETRTQEGGGAATPPHRVLGGCDPPPDLHPSLRPTGSIRLTAAFHSACQTFHLHCGGRSVYLSVSQVTSSVRSQTGVNAMSVYRLLLRLCGHLAVRISQVQSPELLRRHESRLAGEAATSETRRHPQRGEDRKRGGGGAFSSLNL